MADHFEQEMQIKACKQMDKCKDPVEKLRCACLKRGVKGICSMGRTFRIFDDNDNKKLELSEFSKGLKEYDPNFTDSEIQQVFNQFDKDGSGLINFEEFLQNLRPPMPERRILMIEKAFQKMDKTRDGIITTDDMKDIYDVSHHPKYLNGDWTKKQCYEAVLKTFDDIKSPDGKITKEEFMNYYAGVSASIDDDIYFDLMMRNAWKL